MTVYLITGIPGWLGDSFLPSLLGQNAATSAFTPMLTGDQIRCLCLEAAPMARLRAAYPSVRFFQGDVTKPDSMAAFFDGAAGGTIFHIAGVVHPGLSVRPFFKVNAEGTANVLNLAIAAGIRKMIYISSNSAVGVNSNHDGLLTEQSPRRPYMSYGLSKMQAEAAVNQAHQKGYMETVTLRPTWFYGPGQPPRQTVFFRMVQQGRMPLMGEGGNKRSLAYVDDVSQAMLLAAAKQISGETYWIADARPYAMSEIVAVIERLMEKEFAMPVAHRRLNLPAWTGDCAEWCDWCLQHVGLYSKRIHVLSEMNKTIACSVAKAQRELGFCPTVGLEEGMRRSIRWCIDRGHLSGKSGAT